MASSNEPVSMEENTALPDAVAVLNKNNMCKRFHSLLRENLKIQAKYDAMLSKLEAKNEAEKSKNYDKRAEVVIKLMKPKTGDGPKEKPIYFWLSVFKATELCNHVKNDDVPILQNLYDIRTKIHADVPGRHFVLEFYFEPNKYFSNAVLTKTYYFKDIDVMPVLQEYDGFKIDRCEGCKIDWTIEELERRREKHLSWSFFDFFDPPTMPEEEETELNQDEYRLKKYKLKQDFLIGCYIKEQLLPKAMLFFTKGFKESSGNSFEAESESAKNAENLKKLADNSSSFCLCLGKDCKQVQGFGSGDINLDDDRKK